MSAPIADEAPRADAADAVTFSFADPAAGVSGLARAGFTEDGSSGLAVLFAGDEPVTARAETDGGGEREWAAIRAAGVTTAVVEPGRAWTVAFDDGAGRGFALEVSAASAAAGLGEGVGGMTGYDQLCTVTGDVRTGSGTVRVACLGQRGRLWGAPDWERLELTRSVGVWIDGGAGVALHAARPAGADGQDEEARRAWVFDGDGPLAVDEPRLTTISDVEGHQRRAGLELWVHDEDHPRRAAGELVGGTSLELGRLRLDCAFLRWRMDGREGVGRYDILRRVG